MIYLEWHYFVSYTYNFGNGYSGIRRNRMIGNFSDIVELNDYLKEFNKLEGVVITTYKLINIKIKFRWKKDAE